LIEIFSIYALGMSVAIFLLYFFGVSVAPYMPNKIKNEHFECGLPASASTPKKANFGFFIYAIMFIVADMTALFFSLFVFGLDKHSSMMASLFALVIALAIFLANEELKKGENENVKNT